MKPPSGVACFPRTFSSVSSHQHIDFERFYMRAQNPLVEYLFSSFTTRPSHKGRPVGRTPSVPTTIRYALKIIVRVRPTLFLCFFFSFVRKTPFTYPSSETLVSAPNLVPKKWVVKRTCPTIRLRRSRVLRRNDVNPVRIRRAVLIAWHSIHAGLYFPLENVLYSYKYKVYK